MKPDYNTTDEIHTESFKKLKNDKSFEPFGSRNLLFKASAFEKAELPRSRDGLPKATSRNQFLTADQRI